MHRISYSWSPSIRYRFAAWKQCMNEKALLWWRQAPASLPSTKLPVPVWNQSQPFRPHSACEVLWTPSCRTKSGKWGSGILRLPIILTFNATAALRWGQGQGHRLKRSRVRTKIGEAVRYVLNFKILWFCWYYIHFLRNQKPNKLVNKLFIYDKWFLSYSE